MSELVQFFRTRRKANLSMMIICVAVFIVLSVLGDTEDAGFMLEHGACYLPYVKAGEYYRLVTSMFLHFGFLHLLYNMLALLFMGDMLENNVGAVRYLIIYLVGGICGNLLSCMWENYTGKFAVSAGASGAIFSVIGANLAIALKNRKRISRNYLQRLALITVLMILQGFMEPGTDAMAHLGGAAAGFLLGFLLTAGMHGRVSRYPKN